MPIAESSGRASPPTERVVAVLDFLARHPHGRFGVSELARRLGLSKPTCLGLVTTLTDPGCRKLVEYQIADDVEAHGVPVK